MDSTTCFFKRSGQVVAILNCHLRQDREDAIMAHPLNTVELNAYGKYKREGKNDDWIFGQLYPPRPPRRGRIRDSLATMTKGQLVHVVLRKLGCSLPSLKKMSKPDLRELYLVLDRRARGGIPDLTDAIAAAKNTRR